MTDDSSCDPEETSAPKPFSAPAPPPLLIFSSPPPPPLLGDVVDIYQREFLALRERLHLAEQENLRRSKELNLVLEEIKKALAEKQALRDTNRTWSSLSGGCRGRSCCSCCCSSLTRPCACRGEQAEAVEREQQQNAPPAALHLPSPPSPVGQRRQPASCRARGPGTDRR